MHFIKFVFTIYLYMYMDGCEFYDLLEMLWLQKFIRQGSTIY